MNVNFVFRTAFGIILLILFVSTAKDAKGVCNVPAGLTTTNITQTGAKLNWNATVADSFLVRYNETGSTNYFYKTVKPGTSLNTTISGLYPGTTYSWTIHTYCGGGASGAYPSAVQFTTLTGTVSCVTPNRTVANVLSSAMTTVSWNVSVLADSFMIRYAPVNSTNYIWAKVPGSSHSYTINNLLPNTTYDWRVRCICASSPTQSYSAASYFTTPASNCGTPDVYYFTSSSITSSGATVSWAAVSGASSYNVRYAVRYSNNWVTVSSASVSKTLGGLLPNTAYEYQVQSVCSGGLSLWSASGIFTTASLNLILTRGPYLQQSTTSSIYLRWRTNVASDTKVRYGTSSGNLNMTAVNSASVTEHIIQLTGLAANTKYYYSIGATSVTLQGDTGNYFVTNPPVGSTGAVRIWAIGDFGVNSNAQRQVRDAYRNYPGSANTNIWLWLGDNAYASGTDAEYSTSVFSQYPYQMKKWVIWPASGNHDLLSANASSQTGPFFDNFTMPKYGEAGGLASGTEAYYSFNYANIHFICLESTDAAFRSTTGAMANWLRNDLIANTQRWTVVYFHHPPYSKGSHNSDSSTELIEMRTNIVPILETYKVDLVLSGHSHSYERSMLIKGHYGLETTFNAATMAVNSGTGIYPLPYTKSTASNTGTVYVVCGVSGQIGGTSSGWPHNAMISSSVSNFGSLVIDVAGDRLDCRFLTSTGNIFDQFTIQKTGVPRLANQGDNEIIEDEVLSVFPNPMNNEAIINYNVKSQEYIQLQLFDINGQAIHTFVDGVESEGQYQLLLNKEELKLPAGIYFIRFITGEKISLRKILVQ